MAKSAEAFRTISEVSALLDTPAHVLRFWESRFSQVKPVKRAGGRRYYRPGDVALLGGIKKLLHGDGMTIRGVQKLLREQGARHVAAISPVTVAEEGMDAPGPQPTTKPWPQSPSPETADRRQALLPDPDDSAAEAPMQVDVPTLPAGDDDNVLPLVMPPATKPTPEPVAEVTASAPPARSDVVGAEHPPAASLLRAMDTLRARDKKAELLSVYLRLTRLRDRVASSDPRSRG